MIGLLRLVLVPFPTLPLLPTLLGPAKTPNTSLHHQELTYIIKQDIASLNSQILALQQFTRQNLNQGGKQVSEHNNNVVMMLQSKLADTSIGFKDVLEIRTQNMKASRDRTEQFTYTGPHSAQPSSGSFPPPPAPSQHTTN